MSMPINCSPLATYYAPAKFGTTLSRAVSGWTGAIDTITIHCTVGQGTAQHFCDFFAYTIDRAASCNYCVGEDGSIGISVPEPYRSLCSSDQSNDARAVTIEVSSDATEPFSVTSEAYEALLDLVTDICKRNKIKQLVWSDKKTDRVNHKNGCNMTVHKDYADKTCPGTYLYNKHQHIAEEVNRRLMPTINEFRIVGITATTIKAYFDAGKSKTVFNYRLYDTDLKEEKIGKTKANELNIAGLVPNKTYYIELFIDDSVLTPKITVNTLQDYPEEPNNVSFALADKRLDSCIYFTPIADWGYWGDLGYSKQYRISLIIEGNKSNISQDVKLDDFKQDHGYYKIKLSELSKDFLNGIQPGKNIQIGVQAILSKPGEAKIFDSNVINCSNSVFVDYTKQKVDNIYIKLGSYFKKAMLYLK